MLEWGKFQFIVNVIGCFNRAMKFYLMKGRSARMGDKAFVPFYLIPNKQRIIAKEVPTKFRNHMNMRHHALNQQQEHCHYLNKRRAFFLNAEERFSPQKNFPIQPSPQIIKSRLERKVSSHFDNDEREAYYQQIRDELEEMAFYQSRRPFKATEVPTIWRNTNSEDLNIKSNTEFSPQLSHKLSHSKQSTGENNLKAGKTNSYTPASKRKHLNRGLDAIIDQERPRTTGQAFIGSISAGNNEYHNKTYHAPFLDRYQMNGDKRHND